MRKLKACLGVAVALGSTSPLLQAQMPVIAPPPLAALRFVDADAPTPARDWVTMAGCPECVDRSAEPLDGSEWITRLNLEQDGLESTRYEPSDPATRVAEQAPARQEDLVGGVDVPSEATLRAAVHEVDNEAPAPATQPSTDVQAQGVIAVATSLASSAEPWARGVYRQVLEGIARMRQTARGVLFDAMVGALVNSAQDHRQAAPVVTDHPDPEQEAPMDSLTTAWIDAVRDTAGRERAEQSPAATSGAPAAPTVIARSNVVAQTSTEAVEEGDKGSFLGLFVAGSDPATAGPAAHGASAGHASSACEQPGCGGISLPRPIDSPGRLRTQW